jgi:serine/threonine protein kinase
MTDLIGQSLGRYHIIEQLGEGGMAIVYKAYDTRLETDVAVKVIRVENLTLGTMERALKRFEREAKSLAKLTHPNIVKVMDYGDYEGKPFLVLPYLPGGTLKQKLGKAIPWSEAVKMLLPIAEALDYAHSQKMVHRDVKPANILLTERGQPMLTDFGIAKVLDIEETMDLTGTSAAVGTPEYMAPEQATAKIADHRADIYALGIVLYEMITGRKPYTADTPMAVLIMHARDPLPRPSKFVSGIPNSLEKVLIKALAKSPDDRYQSMGEMFSALEGLFGGKRKITTKKNAPKKKEKKPKVEKKPAQRRWNLQKTIISVVLIGLVLAGIFGIPALLNQSVKISDPTNTTLAAMNTPIMTSTPISTVEPTPINAVIRSESSGAFLRKNPGGAVLQVLEDGTNIRVFPEIKDVNGTIWLYVSADYNETIYIGWIVDSVVDMDVDATKALISVPTITNTPPSTKTPTHLKIWDDEFDKNTLDEYVLTGSVSWDSNEKALKLGSGKSMQDSKVYFKNENDNNQNLTVQGKVFLPIRNYYYFESVAIGLKNSEDEYWSTLLFGNTGDYGNKIAILKNDEWVSPEHKMGFETGWYWIEVYVDYKYNRLKMKSWQDGETEPTWQISQGISSTWQAEQIGFRHFGAGIIVDDLIIEAIE